ncbi:Cyclopentanol dehydrogenase [compost metagenome]
MTSTDLDAVALAVKQRLLGGKFLEPKAVADAILFMLSDASRGIHGQDIVVDGGYTLS